MNKFHTTKSWTFVVLALSAAIATACGAEAQKEATTYEVPVVADGTEMEAFETDEGYIVELSAVIMRSQNMEFTVGGEAHDDSGLTLRQPLYDLVIASAHAHPNHAAGGEAGGLLVGPVTMDWRPDEVSEIGVGEFLEGDYSGYGFEFAVGDADSSLGASVIARLEGTATTAGGESIEFYVEVDGFEGAAVTGGALSMKLPDDEIEYIGLEFRAADDWSGATVFDGVRFSRFAGDDDQPVAIDSDSTDHTLIRLALGSHEFYGGAVVSSR